MTDTVTTVDLAGWLLDRIAEDEAAMIREHWAPAHFAMRYLDECEAKRRIVELHALGQPWCECGVWDTTEHGDPGYEICPTLRLLALPYADRPGYQETWRP